MANLIGLLRRWVVLLLVVTPHWKGSQFIGDPRPEAQVVRLVGDHLNSTVRKRNLVLALG